MLCYMATGQLHWVVLTYACEPFKSSGFSLAGQRSQKVVLQLACLTANIHAVNCPLGPHSKEVQGALGGRTVPIQQLQGQQGL